VAKLEQAKSPVHATSAASSTERDFFLCFMKATHNLATALHAGSMSKHQLCSQTARDEDCYGKS